MHSGEYHNTHDFGMSGDEYYSTRRRKSPFWVAFWTSLIVSLVTVFLSHFVIFPWLQQSSQPVVVPKLSGLKIAQAILIVSSMGLRLERMAQQADEQPIGTVLSHLPVSGTRVKSGSIIRVILSTGLSSKGAPITPSSGTTLSPSPPARAVIPTTPEASRDRSSSAPPRTESSTVVDPSNKVSVPRLTDMSLTEAKRRMKQAGLQLRHISFGANEDKSPHWVLQQSPRPATMVPRGSPVDLTINRDDL